MIYIQFVIPALHPQGFPASFFTWCLTWRLYRGLTSDKLTHCLPQKRHDIYIQFIIPALHPQGFPTSFLRVIMICLVFLVTPSMGALHINILSRVGPRFYMISHPEVEYSSIVFFVYMVLWWSCPGLSWGPHVWLSKVTLTNTLKYFFFLRNCLQSRWIKNFI